MKEIENEKDKVENEREKVLAKIDQFYKKSLTELKDMQSFFKVVRPLFGTLSSKIKDEDLKISEHTAESYRVYAAERIRKPYES